MTINEYLSKQIPERKELLSSIHEIILRTNPKLSAEVAPMMGAEMIQYKIKTYFVYGLASGKNHMTLHSMPMYAVKPIHKKYSGLLKKAKFRKGCINFKTASDMPLDITEQFLTDCSKIDWQAIMKKYGK
jgi:hypothetical protein